MPLFGHFETEFWTLKEQKKLVFMLLKLYLLMSFDLPCCLIKTPTLLHRDKNSRNYVTKISFLCKKKEFSSASFPHVFKAIGPLEKILETKNHFFSPFKKVTFSVSRILNAKTKKSDVFWTHFLNLDFIWGKSRFLKLVFLPFVSSIKIHVFYWKYCLSVLL